MKHDLLVVDQNFQVSPNPYLRTIHPFSEIIRRDRGGRADVTGRFKQKACRELSYVYHMVDHRSPYAQYDRETRSVMLKKAIFEDEKWKPDSIILQALDTYEDLHDTAFIRLLKASREAINKLEQFFRNVDVADPKEAKELLMAMANMAKVIDSLNRLEELAKKEETEKTTYGNVKTNKYSEG